MLKLIKTYKKTIVFDNGAQTWSFDFLQVHEIVVK